MQNRRRHFNLFFLELIVAIFFFAVISAVCVQLFSESFLLSRKSRDLTEAVNHATNLAEIFRNWDGSEKQWEDLVPGGNWSEKGWSIAYDENWNYVSEDGTNRILIRFKEEKMRTAKIQVCKSETEEVIYELTVEVKNR